MEVPALRRQRHAGKPRVFLLTATDIRKNAPGGGRLDHTAEYQTHPSSSPSPAMWRRIFTGGAVKRKKLIGAVEPGIGSRFARAELFPGLFERWIAGRRLSGVKPQR